MYAELSALETLGSARRGYFVEGLGGAQFALSAAVERLRSHRDATEEPVVLAAQDPANLYGAVLPWPRREEQARRPARVPGAYVVLLGGQAVLYVEASGRGLVSLADHPEDWLPQALDALADFVRSGGPLRRLAVERFDGEPVMGSAVEPLLVERGFRPGPRQPCPERVSDGKPVGNVYYGTSSWTDPTLLKSKDFYPPDAKKPEERLRFYAEHFPLVEVDATFYALPSERNAGLWAERTPDELRLQREGVRPDDAARGGRRSRCPSRSGTCCPRRPPPRRVCTRVTCPRTR